MHMYTANSTATACSSTNMKNSISPQRGKTQNNVNMGGTQKALLAQAKKSHSLNRILGGGMPPASLVTLHTHSDKHTANPPNVWWWLIT